ncbi:MAG: ATP-binding protein [Ignavibacteria bacterium]|nr:ATP-binding protein [Ignavibacteria bacterium]
MEITMMLKRLAFRLILVVGLAALLIIGVYSGISIRYQSARLQAEVERHANQLSETVKKSTRYDMLFNRREAVHQIINNVGTGPGINEVRVLNKEGKIIYSSEPTSIGHMVDKKAESCFACHAADRPLERLSLTERTRIFRLHPDSARMLGVINPIYNEPACWEAGCHAHKETQSVLGVLDVTTSLAEIDDQMAVSTTVNIVFAVCAVIALSIIIGYFVRRWVGMPVNVLIRATREVGGGNLVYRIPQPGDDDLGMLARAFNAMTEKLSEARLQLFQSDKMASLGRLAAGVAHELNNPLTGVLTYSSFLLNRAGSNTELRADLDVIVREATRSREIVKSLLDFARQSVPKKTLANMNDIIERSVAVLDKQLAVKGIHVHRNLDDNLPMVRVDCNQMQQVFMNLLVNASDAVGEKGGEVTVTSSLAALPPRGTAQIKHALCPKGHDLMDNEVKIASIPSVKVNVRGEAREGSLWLDPIYGSSSHRYGMEGHKGETLEFFCSRCGISLQETGVNCPLCSAPVYGLHVPPQGMFQGCTRWGCEWQNWEAVEAKGYRKYLEVMVSDTGAGIPPADLQKIFDPFYTTKGQKGTGLGLAVVWGIIDNHNGTIRVASALGSGTSFVIRLPINHSS